MIRKSLSAITVIALGFGMTGCSGFKANAEDCKSILVYVDEVNSLIDATTAKISDSSYRRAGARLWSEKLDELERDVKPREEQLQEALADWVSNSRAVADAIQPNSMDTRALNEAADAFQASNVVLGNMCSN